MPTPHLRIGLTGGIGSGKSTVALSLQQLGACVIDTDAISRSLTAAGGAAIGPIAREFGQAFIEASGALDRSQMRARAFNDPSARARLEAILHPLIGIETARQAANSASATIVFDVPLLVESDRWRSRVDKVLVLDCRESTQVARVMARSGWSLSAVQSVIAQQAQRAARRACADAVIFNDEISAQALDAEVRSLWMRWRD
jgi:dephospho-CoA kinase